MSDNKPFKIRREDPPAVKQRGRTAGDPNKIDREVAHFKKNPGVWFKVREAAAGGAYRVYKNRGCEVRTKLVGTNRYDIWASYPTDAED